MTVWALVPVKPFVEAKSRLGDVIPPAERRGLAQFFLNRMLEVLAQVPVVREALVISPDPAALALARAHGARTLREVERAGLNGALRRGTAAAHTAGASAVLVLPIDLPLVTAAELADLVTAEGELPWVTVAPDRHGTGTNALFVRPPGWVDYAFGPGSFARHVRLAEQAGAHVRVCRAPGLALDVDVPDDWALYQAAQTICTGPSAAQEAT